MITMEFCDLVGIELADIHAAFVDAFSEYEVPMEMPIERLQAMLTTRDYRPELSTACVVDGRIVGFVLVGGRLIDGQLCAYDCATGVIRAFQQQKIGSQLLAVALERVRVAGAKRFVLEVLEHNSAAQALYLKHGFEKTRYFHCYRTQHIPNPESLSWATWGHDDQMISSVDMALYQAYQPSWQYALASYQHAVATCNVVTMYDSATLVAYGIIEGQSASIMQIGVHPDYRYRAVFESLFARLADVSACTQLRIINVEAQTWLDHMLVDLGWEHMISQHEMAKQW